MNAKEKRDNIIFITEFIIKTITAIAVILFAVSILGMIETWSVSGTHLVVFITCLAWLGTVWTYKNILKK